MDKEVIQARGKDAVRIIRELIRKGSVNRIVVKTNKGKILLNIPVTMVVVGALLSPMLIGASVVLAFVKECKIEIER